MQRHQQLMQRPAAGKDGSPMYQQQQRHGHMQMTPQQRQQLAMQQKSMHAQHADRLLLFMRIPKRKPQLDFRIQRIDFCFNALFMRIARRVSESTPGSNGVEPIGY